MKTIVKILALVAACAMLVGCPPQKPQEDAEPAEATGEKVSLDFHIMSKCPYGVKVINAVAPVMEKMGDRVDLKVHYIGRIKDGEVTAMHGPTEVQGNVVQLCANELGDQKQWMSFLSCQFKGSEWRKIPEGWEKCATEAKLDVAKMKACYEGEQGKKLITDSVEFSKAKKATGSPTIFLEGERYKGNRSEDAFARSICGAMKEPKAAYCKEIPEPTKVAVTIVNDKRCKEKECNTGKFLGFIRQSFEGAEIKEFDYSDAEGKALFEKSEKAYLPIAVFGPEVAKETAGYNRLKKRLSKMKDSEDQVYMLGRSWDPAAEVCDDGEDNTGNGLVDCDDESCKGKKECREEIKNKLDVFVMSQCPYGVTTVDAVVEVLDNFKKDRSKLDFEINYVGRMAGDKPTSMHGQGEVDENIRQLCAQKHYNKDYQFMEYVTCRNKDYRSPDWKSCATGKISAAVIEKCFDSGEGEQLLIASVEKSNSLGITGSPGWLLNNRFDMKGRNPNAIKTAFCARNEIEGCENELSAGKGRKPPSGSCGGAPAAKPAGKPAPKPLPKPVPKKVNE